MNLSTCTLFNNALSPVTFSPGRPKCSRELVRRWVNTCPYSVLGLPSSGSIRDHMAIELTETGLVAIAGLLTTATAAFVTALVTGSNANKRQEIQAGIDREARQERAATEKEAREEQAAFDQEAREAEAYRSRVREALAPVTHFVDLTTGFVAQLFTLRNLDTSSMIPS